MLDVKTHFPLPLPDDPNKWDGWSKYKSHNLYERLCLDPRQNPTNEIIEVHCRELLRWWQKKLPLKNQPSNPLAQMLRPGLEESSRYLAEARLQLLDPDRRRRMDEELALHAHDEAVAEFHKYLTFAIADGFLTPDEEKNLHRFGREQGLTLEEMRGYIAAELRESGAQRAKSAEAAAQASTARERAPRQPQAKGDPREDFMRMLRLTNLDTLGMTDETRDAFVNMAHNLGIEPDEAEDLVDLYLGSSDDEDETEDDDAPATPAAETAASPPVIQEAPPSAARASDFINSIDGPMLFVPGGEFVMGSEEHDAGPTERPLSRITLSAFFMSKFPITNAEYERFDPTHSRKRAAGAGDRHPVVYVSSLEAIKFCQWLSARERKKYRLPTEAEWEYAARGTDGRKYPWGNHDGSGDLANFADKNTVFAWSDHEIDDGFAESSPVGAFPNGASPFGVLDMAGNVWEWCLDFFEPYRGGARTNPHGTTSGAKRVYRGGSWKSRFNSLRATARGSNVPGYSCNDVGFRVVCEGE